MRPASLIICSSNRPQLLAETLPGGNWMPTAITSRSSGDRKTTRFKDNCMSASGPRAAVEIGMIAEDGPDEGKDGIQLPIHDERH